MIYYFNQKIKRSKKKVTLFQKLKKNEKKERETIEIKIKQQINENRYYKEVIRLKKTIYHWNDLFSEQANEKRMEDWIRIEVTVFSSLISSFFLLKAIKKRISLFN